MASIRKIGRNWFYRYVDADGIQRERKGCPDRRETEAMAAHAETEASKIRSGMIDPRESVCRKHEARPLAEHVGAWHVFLIGKGSTQQHADLSRNRVQRLIDLARAKRIT